MPGQFDAIHAGHTDIDEQDIRRLVAEDLDGLQPVDGLADNGIGCLARDITKQIASFEQDLVTNPKGILLHPMQADPFIDPINRAIEAGVSVTTFAADSPKSKRTAYVTSDNLAEAAFAQSKVTAPQRESMPARKAANGRASDAGWEEF